MMIVLVSQGAITAAKRSWPMTLAKFVQLYPRFALAFRRGRLVYLLAAALSWAPKSSPTVKSNSRLRRDEQAHHLAAELGTGHDHRAALADPRLAYPERCHSRGMIFAAIREVAQRGWTIVADGNKPATGLRAAGNESPGRAQYFVAAQRERPDQEQITESPSAGTRTWRQLLPGDQNHN